MQYKKIPIQDVNINARIRKDLGDIKSLADNIKQIGLLSPIVLNEHNELLAGERRLEACKILGWSQIDSVVINTVDEEHNISVEICENINRQNFTREELVNAGVELERIESIKAASRMKAGRTDPTKNSSEGGETRQIVAKKIGMSFDTYRKNKFIIEHKDLLLPGEFADWNNQLSSTNKIYNIIKKQLGEEKSKQKATPKTEDADQQKLNSYINKIKELEEMVSKPITIEDLSTDDLDAIKAAIKEDDDKTENKLTGTLNSAYETIADLTRQVDVLQDDLLSRSNEITALKNERDSIKLQMETYRKEVQPTYDNCVTSDIVFDFCKKCVEFQNTVIAPIENGDSLTQCVNNNILYQRLYNTCKSMIDSLDRVIKKASITDVAIIDDEVVIDY